MSRFSGPNKSNTPMQQLLLSRDYQPSGIIENLEPGDSELVFLKTLQSTLA